MCEGSLDSVTGRGGAVFGAELPADGVRIMGVGGVLEECAEFAVGAFVLEGGDGQPARDAEAAGTDGVVILVRAEGGFGNDEHGFARMHAVADRADGTSDDESAGVREDSGVRRVRDDQEIVGGAMLEAQAESFGFRASDEKKPATQAFCGSDGCFQKAHAVHGDSRSECRNERGSSAGDEGVGLGIAGFREKWEACNDGGLWPVLLR